MLILDAVFCAVEELGGQDKYKKIRQLPLY